MDFTPQVETLEIADADLDNVSGGNHSPILGDAVGTYHAEAPGDLNSTVEVNTQTTPDSLKDFAGM
jgi:hypothetical protein